MITRYEQKMIDREKNKFNKSVNRYQVSNDKVKKSTLLDFQIRKSGKKSLSTIDFS